MSKKIFICKNLASYLLFEKTCKISFFSEKFWRISIVCKKLANYIVSNLTLQDIFFARTLQDIYHLQELRKKSTDCKHLARYRLFARTLKDFYCFQKPCETSKICRNFTWYVFLPEPCRIIILQESCKVLNICKKSADYLSFTRTMQDIYISQESWEVSIFGRISQ